MADPRSVQGPGDDAWESAPWDAPPPPSVSGEHRAVQPETDPAHDLCTPNLARAERAEAALVAARNELTLLRARVARLQDENDQLRGEAARKK
jgi:hypothetical protein